MCSLMQHSMARANLKKVKASQLLLPQHQSTYPRLRRYSSVTQDAQNLHQLKSPFQTQIYLVNVLFNVNIVKQDLLNTKQFFLNFMKLDLKGWISIDADSGPLGYVLWCCGSRSWEVFTFFQIGSVAALGLGLYQICLFFIFLCNYLKYLLLFSTAEVMQRLLEQKNKALGTGGGGAAIMPPAQSS